MKTTNHDKWRNLKGTVYDTPIVQLVEEAIVREQKAGHRLKICVGSDSQGYGSHISYATVVVVVREGKGGFMFIKNEKGKPHIGTKERMLKEVALSVETAYSICQVLERYQVDLEVHADINTDAKFESNVALKEAMGYIKGMGFTFKAKPNAFASSSCADRVV
ncbi:MAG: ribonuclease H-like YkuK family protein [Bacteroidota bacterium]